MGRFLETENSAKRDDKATVLSLSTHEHQQTFFDDFPKPFTSTMSLQGYVNSKELSWPYSCPPPGPLLFCQAYNPF
jgi:hypothetical protein